MSRINARSKFLRMIEDGTPPIGTFIAATDPATTAIVGRCGYDYVVVDREHGPLDTQTALNHIRASEAVNTTPIVRVLENNPALIQQALDLGAHGVIVPKVSTVEQAHAALSATRYQSGGRGACPAVAAADWDIAGWRTHIECSNQDVIVIPLIETAEGVRNARAIADIPGIDFLFFGPADLAQDMGLDLNEDLDRLGEMWEDFAADVHAAGAWAGAPLGLGFDGFDFGSVSMDLMMLRDVATEQLEHWRGALPRVSR